MDLKSHSQCQGPFSHETAHLFVTVEDLERNDGSNEKPYYMSKKLMKILGKKNKPEENGN